MTRQSPERQYDEHRENGQDGDAANVLHPFAHVQPKDGRQRHASNRRRHDRERNQAILRQPRRRRANEIRNLGWHSVEDRRCHRDGVDQDVPRGEKAAKIAESAMRPHVEPAFKRHLTIEADDRSCHGQIKCEHGAEPEEHLCAAQSSGDTYPRTAYDAQRPAPAQGRRDRAAAASRAAPGLALRFGHRVMMVAHRAQEGSSEGTLL